jgi:hypothetical protein
MCCGRAQPSVLTAKWQSAHVPGRECLYLRLPGRHSTQPGCSDGLPPRKRQQVELRGPLGPIRSLTAKQGNVLRSRVTSARSRSAARSSLITPLSRPGRSSLLRPEAGRAAPPSSAQPAGPLRRPPGRPGRSQPALPLLSPPPGRPDHSSLINPPCWPCLLRPAGRAAPPSSAQPAGPLLPPPPGRPGRSALRPAGRAAPSRPGRSSLLRPAVRTTPL